VVIEVEDLAEEDAAVVAVSVVEVVEEEADVRDSQLMLTP
jgi:hypothetical protein